MFEHLPHFVKVYEVGPRDGLQNEAVSIATSDKIRLIQALAASGLKNIEITSFVSPKWVPQLADGLAVAKGLTLPTDVRTNALVPNLKGYAASREAGLTEIALFLSATETHSQKNINKSIDDALATVGELAYAARADGVKIRCYLSVVFMCPYEGWVSPDKVARITHKLLEIGVDELSLGDTIGAATPNRVISLVGLIQKEWPISKIALHFHDTYGMALANVVAGLESGVTTFDASIGGMGGCPYAPGAAGNLATEDLVYMLEGLGIQTGIDLNKLVDAGQLAQEIIGKKLPGRYLQACLARRQRAPQKAAEC